MKNIHFINTEGENFYFYNMNRSRLFLIHPILYRIMTEKVADDNDNVLYYKRKYAYFEKHNLLNEEFIKPEFVKLSPAIVRESFVNTNQVTFEVTDRCNLACKYCGYRDFYDDYDERKGVNIDVLKAKKVIDYLCKLWKSDMNNSFHKIVDIGFYGGEPLLNFDFISNIVEYVNELDCVNRLFTFSMTTNGLLLDKYMDYLVDHDFGLLISLDGDKDNNMNRVNKFNKSTHDELIRNIDLLKEKYPMYFDEKVNFNSVLHDKNPLDDLFLFFKNKYNKTPRISLLSRFGRSDEKEQEFMLMNRNLISELNNSIYKNEIVEWMGIKRPGFINYVYFLYEIMGSVYMDYNELISDIKGGCYYPSGTCVPFSKRLFVTVNSKILPCEKVGQNFVLGYINDELDLDFDKISSVYNELFNGVIKECLNCYNYKSCMLCLLESQGKCDSYMDIKSFNKRYKLFVESLEKRPHEFELIKNKITIR